MDLVDRLKQYIQHLEMPVTQFADTALIPRPTLSQILGRRNQKISNELMEKLHFAFPELNINWLLFGDEPMEVQSQSVNNQANTHQPTAPKPQQSAPIQSAPQPAPQQPQVPNPYSFISPSATEIPFEQFEIANEASNSAEARANNLHEALKNPSKKIQNVIIFFDDNSFEIFTPAPR